MLTFFYSTGTCSTAVRMALEEASMPFEGIEVSWQRKLHLEELAKVNSLGQVPVLVENGKSLTQTAALLEYIAEKNPTKKLLPAHGTWEYTKAKSWLTYLAADFHQGFGAAFSAGRMTTSAPAQAEIKSYAIQNLQKHLAYIDQALEGNAYILGNNFSVADIYLFVVTGWCKYQEIKTSPYKNLHSYMKRIYERPAVQKVLKEEGMLDYLPA